MNWPNNLSALGRHNTCPYIGSISVGATLVVALALNGLGREQDGMGWETQPLRGCRDVKLDLRNVVRLIPLYHDLLDCEPKTQNNTLRYGCYIAIRTQKNNTLSHNLSKLRPSATNELMN